MWRWEQSAVVSGGNQNAVRGGKGVAVIQTVAVFKKTYAALMATKEVFSSSAGGVHNKIPIKFLGDESSPYAQRMT